MDIQLGSQMGESDLTNAMDEFNRRNISFNDEAQVNQLLQLVTDMHNHTRTWVNNGHTPHEINEESEKDQLQPLPERKTNPVQKVDKVGRNEPCSCGSGKKYKKCCMTN
ncbi:SEC-C metal-binding domain-containing protein [Tenuibacillus multivorans]|uniref:SEC-C metal-binding domain-containing protein n=1 Tax=Tenuibacillus multivorans TaxID=237069 RepID=UPI0011750CDB|nr:SEC-C metal-binding domain-containing protein [Tenuibacillus multivorans]GEL77090.1 hypothetical protein TMU01_13250 [Tenuibacillus multivorans]